jgi:hypothetical protein
MRGLRGKVAGQELQLLRYANDWLAVRLPNGRVEYPAPDEIALSSADLVLFDDQDRSHVGDFWLDWELDDDAVSFRRRAGRHQSGDVPCPQCEKSIHVNDDGRIKSHPQRTARTSMQDTRCAGSGLLARPNLRELADELASRRLVREARRAGVRPDEGIRREAQLIDLDELDRPVEDQQ